MNLDLKPTVLSAEYDFEDEYGYKFHVVVNQDEFGWHANVNLSSHGRANVMGAIAALRLPAEHFLRLIKEEKP